MRTLESAATYDGSTLYADDTASKQIVWFKINPDGSLTQAGTTGSGSVNSAGQVAIDRADKFLYDFAFTMTNCFRSCISGLWGATIASSGALTPISGTPWQTTGPQAQGTFAIVP